MVTDYEKEERLVLIEGVTIFGLAHGMWDLFGEASFATSTVVGDLILKNIKMTMDLSFNGQTVESILDEIVTMFSNEINVMKAGKATFVDDKIVFTCEKCFFSRGTKGLQASGVQPFYCPAYTVISSAMNKNLGKKVRFLNRSWDEQADICTLEIKVI